MRLLKFALGCTVVGLLLAFNIGAAQVGKRAVMQSWTGKIAEDAALKKAPKNGYITDKKVFEDLWKAWRGDAKVPEIDFAKKIVFVQIAGGPNIPSSSYEADADGNLRAKTLSTLIGGPGFGYALEVLNREGIKTYQGKAIE